MHLKWQQGLLFKGCYIRWLKTVLPEGARRIKWPQFPDAATMHTPGTLSHGHIPMQSHQLPFLIQMHRHQDRPTEAASRGCHNLDSAPLLAQQRNCRNPVIDRKLMNPLCSVVGWALSNHSSRLPGEPDEAPGRTACCSQLGQVLAEDIASKGLASPPTHQDRYSQSSAGPGKKPIGPTREQDLV